MKYIYPFFMALWRDAFGKNGYYIPVIKIRFVQHVIAFIMTFLLCYFDKGLKWWWCIWIATWLQIWWSLGHGACYDCGTHGKPDEAMIKRYEKMFGYKLVCKIFDESDWYGFGFDFVLLTIRYTYPLVFVCFWFSPVLFTLGLVVSGLYAIYRYCPFCQQHRLLDVEIWAGFVAGLYFAFL